MGRAGDREVAARLGEGMKWKEVDSEDPEDKI